MSVDQKQQPQRRRNGIDRFNIAVDLTDSKKFIRFKRAAGDMFL